MLLKSDRQMIVFLSLMIVFLSFLKLSFPFWKKTIVFENDPSFWTFRNQIKNVFENDRFYKNDKRPFFIWMDHSIQTLKTRPRTFPWFSWVPKSKFEANRSRGSWVMIRQTNKQTNWDYNFIYVECRCKDFYTQKHIHTAWL